MLWSLILNLKVYIGNINLICNESIIIYTFTRRVYIDSKNYLLKKFLFISTVLWPGLFGYNEV